MIEEFLRQPERADRRVDVVVAQQPGHRIAEAANAPVVLDRGHEAVLPGRIEQRAAERLHPARIDAGDADALISKPVPRLAAHDGPRTYPEPPHYTPTQPGGHPP